MLEQPKRFAFLFEGQGQQFPGMWKDLYGRGGVASKIFDRADYFCLRENMGFRVTDACFNPESSILFGESYNPIALQLAILTGETATVAYLHERRVPKASINAGHSLGQMATAVETGLMPFDTAIKLTLVRAKAMAKVAETRGLAVYVVSDLRREVGDLVVIVQKTLEELGEDAKGTQITVVNHAKQLLTAGPPTELERVREKIEAFNPRIKLKHLPKIPPSHHPDFKEAQREFNEALKACRAEFNERVEALHLADVRDQIITGAKTLRGALGVQMVSRVIWDRSWARLKKLGVTFGVEIGPGFIFGDMAKVDHPDLNVNPTRNVEEMDYIIGFLATP